MQFVSQRTCIFLIIPAKQAARNSMWSIFRGAASLQYGFSYVLVSASVSCALRRAGTWLCISVRVSWGPSAPPALFPSVLGAWVSVWAGWEGSAGRGRTMCVCHGLWAAVRSGLSLWACSCPWAGRQRGAGSAQQEGAAVRLSAPELLQPVICA